MSLIGELPKFDSKKDDWQVYIERLEQYLEINDISDDKKKAILITAISEDVYKMLRDVCSPILPKNKSYQEIREFLNKQFLVKVSIGRERYNFYAAQHNVGETITEWFARLKRLSVDCKFGHEYETILLDRFVSGLQQSVIMDRLCEENETITLHQAVDIALKKESSLNGLTATNYHMPSTAQMLQSLQNNSNFHPSAYDYSVAPVAAPVAAIPNTPRRTYRKRKANTNYCEYETASKIGAFD